MTITYFTYLYLSLWTRLYVLLRGDNLSIITKRVHFREQCAWGGGVDICRGSNELPQNPSLNHFMQFDILYSK